MPYCLRLVFQPTSHEAEWMSWETRGPLKTAHGLEIFTSRTADMLRLSGHVSAAAPCESILQTQQSPTMRVLVLFCRSLTFREAVCSATNPREFQNQSHRLLLINQISSQT